MYCCRLGKWWEKVYKLCSTLVCGSCSIDSWFLIGIYLKDLASCNIFDVSLAQIMLLGRPLSTWLRRPTNFHWFTYISIQKFSSRSGSWRPTEVPTTQFLSLWWLLVKESWFLTHTKKILRIATFFIIVIHLYGI
jgi:hypothetical protein